MEENGFYTDFETGQVAESLIGFTSSLNCCISGEGIICKKRDIFVCPFPSTSHTQEKGQSEGQGLCCRLVMGLRSSFPGLRGNAPDGDFLQQL